MTGRALILVLCITALSIASADAYEFRLLNGMKVNGGLKSFKDGQFFVDTDFGSVTIDADKLDYIIVEETDAGPSKSGAGVLGIGLGQEERGPEKVEYLAQGDTATPKAPRPEPLVANSVRPAPLTGRSVAPAPLGTFSVDAGKAYPGIFERGRK